MRRAFALLLVLCAALAPARGTGGRAPRAGAELRRALEQVEGLTDAEFAKNGRGGMTVGAVSGGRLVWTKSYGYADEEGKVRATKETVYRIGGTTVKFTALMLLQLVQAGRVNLDDPVEKFFPEINTLAGRFDDAPPVTFRQLATHTSGIGNEPDDIATFTRGPVGEWEKTLVAALPHTRYAARPGAKVIYSNVGYAILGAALARVARQPYIEYVRRHIFDPLGMKHTSFEADARVRPTLAKGYVIKKGELDPTIPEREHAGRGYKIPNGAVYSTVEDLARFVAFELGHGPQSVLRRETLADNYQRAVMLQPAERDVSGYGIGFQVLNYGDLTFLGYGGAVPGYHARADFERASDTGFIVLRNVEGGTLHLSTLKLSGQCLTQLAATRQQAAR